MQAIARSVALATALFLIGASTASAEKPETVPGLPVQLALGDSWPAGAGADPRDVEGYVPQLHEALREGYACLPARSTRARTGCPSLQLVNVAVGGATTPTLIQNQLPRATELLRSRNGDSNPRNDVEVTTIHIGGNDVTNPIIAACLGGLSPACVTTIQSEFAAFAADLRVALRALRGAAGQDATIVIGTYDNPFGSCQLAGVPGAVQLGALALEGGGPITMGLNDIIRAVAAEHDVQVAEVFGRLTPQDWVGGQDCLHPDNSGYDVITDSFAETLGV